MNLEYGKEAVENLSTANGRPDFPQGEGNQIVYWGKTEKSPLEEPLDYIFAILDSEKIKPRTLAFLFLYVNKNSLPKLTFDLEPNRTLVREGKRRIYSRLREAVQNQNPMGGGPSD